jgi:hypothetical protein
MPRHGGEVLTFLEAPETLTRMMALNEHGIPPVAEVGRFLASLGPDARPSDSAKRLIGRLVRARMGSRGQVPVRSARVPPTNYFATGALYSSLGA